MIEAIVWLVALVGIVWVMVLLVSGGRSAHRPRVGSAAAGTVYDMLNEDKRNAIEIIVEGRAEARDPEDKDGNLPELEGSEGREDREVRGARQRD
jgi:hypothetical protein